MSHLAWDTLGVVVVSALLVVVSSGHIIFMFRQALPITLVDLVPFLFRHLFLSQQEAIAASTQRKPNSRIADTYSLVRVPR